MKKINFLITGGAGFIGSAVIRYLINNTNHIVMNIDKLTYAGNLYSLESVKKNKRYSFKKIDICDEKRIEKILHIYQPDIIMNLAAETHVDRSIDYPDPFIKTNIEGTFVLLKKAFQYWNKLKGSKKKSFRFHQVSTDEVFGDIKNNLKIDENKKNFKPNSPYSASKAGSEHLVRAWHKTYGLPTVITNSSNTYGPFHFPEKLVPLIILNAIEGKRLPIYGKGLQIRDWLYVNDHARGLIIAAIKGKPGNTYNVAGDNQVKNIDMVKGICNILEKQNLKKPKGVKKYRELINFVEDRPGHDGRYAISSKKIRTKLKWKPKETFLTGLHKTIIWYLNNLDWCKKIQRNNYNRERLGVNYGTKN